MIEATRGQSTTIDDSSNDGTNDVNAATRLAPHLYQDQDLIRCAAIDDETAHRIEELSEDPPRYDVSASTTNRLSLNHQIHRYAPTDRVGTHWMNLQDPQRD